MVSSTGVRRSQRWNLVEVDVIHAQPPQRRVDRGQDVLTGQAPRVLAVPHRHEHLRGHDHVIALEELAEQPAGCHLARPARVDVRRVVEDDAAVGCRTDERLRRVLIEDPRTFAVVPEAHHPEAHA
jgi:hypothetical protein